MKKISVIGGGTGSYTLLRGLKNYFVDISAIVSMADSGGSAGKLRDEYGVLPAGDVRRCLVALAENSDFWREMFEYRFDERLDNHALGNLFLLAAEKRYGNMALGIQNLSEKMNLLGKVLPVTLDNSHLYAELEDGQRIKGETNIDLPKHDANLKIENVWLEPSSFIYRGAREALMNSDLIVIGPGDLYTSVIPNLLVEGASEAINESPAKKAYVCNVMTKNGETNHFRASDFMREIERYLNGKVDYAILNTKKPAPGVLEKYLEEKSYFVEPDFEGDKKSKVILEDLLSDNEFSRHDSMKLARTIMSL